MSLLSHLSIFGTGQTVNLLHQNSQASGHMSHKVHLHSPTFLSTSTTLAMHARVNETHSTVHVFSTKNESACDT